MNKDVLIRLNGISKSFDGETVLDDLHLEIHDKEFITLLGPSGCGKTTTLRIIGGFETPDAGDVYFDGKRINDLPPYRRQVNTVFQKYALFPHLNVFDNIAFGLRVRKTKDSEIREKVKAMLELVNLRGLTPPRGNAFGRSATAGRHRARAGQRTQSPASRRAACRARPQTAQGYAE